MNHIHVPDTEELVEPVEVATLAHFLNLTDVDGYKEILALIIRTNRARIETYLNRSVVTKTYVTENPGKGNVTQLMPTVRNIFRVEEELEDGTTRNVPSVEYYVTEDDKLVIENTDRRICTTVRYSAGFRKEDAEFDTVSLALLTMCKQTYEASIDDPLTSVKPMLAPIRVEP